MISARTGAGTRRQVSNARFAAATASFMSCAFERGKTPMRSRVSAGLRFSNVWPERDGTHSPSMRLWNTVAEDMDNVLHPRKPTHAKAGLGGSFLHALERRLPNKLVDL